jgi:hypothetical protein
MRIALLSLFVFLFVVPRTANATPAVKEWTFMTFLNGDNSLDSYGPFNINEMEKVGSSDQVNVVVQWASSEAGKAVRLYVKKDNDTNSVTSPVVQDLGVVDMGDYHSVVDFVKWSVQNYPAKHYFLNIWDHGGGWHFQSQFRAFSLAGGAATPGSVITPQDISWDDGSGHFISTQQLGLALGEAAKAVGHKIDLYGSDACLMAMPEVAMEMVDSVEIYAGSEETEPAAGWPYTKLLQQWEAAPTSTATQVATMLTTDYVKSYSNGEHGTEDVTFSAFDLSKIEGVAQSMKALSADLRALDSSGKAKALSAIGKTRTYRYADYGDLIDFLTQLQKSGVNVSARSVQNVNDAAKALVIANAANGMYQGNSNGASIWLPSDSSTLNSYLEKYHGLRFDKDTSWSSALQSVIGAR